MLRRLHELLVDWPEHPLLEQLQAICKRILSLPACGPVKAALSGIELLLSRAQAWEEGAASHVSLSAQLQACAHLARRWRAAEVNSWSRALAACSHAASSAADVLWFPLHRLLFAAAPLEASRTGWLRDVAIALEEFLRASPLGQFERRLALVLTFQKHALLDELAGSSSFGALSSVLYNVHRYYSQFVADARRALDAARQPLETKLTEHAKLAKWEVRTQVSCFCCACTCATHLRTVAVRMPLARPKGLHKFMRQIGWAPRRCACAPNTVATLQSLECLFCRGLFDSHVPLFCVRTGPWLSCTALLEPTKPARVASPAAQLGGGARATCRADIRKCS